MFDYGIDYHSGEYVCAKCGKRIKIAPRNVKNERRGYWGKGQKYNYRGGKGALVNHLKACYRDRMQGRKFLKKENY